MSPCPRDSFGVVSACTRRQNGHSLSSETDFAMYSRSPAVQNDGPRITSPLRAKNGQPQNAGRGQPGHHHAVHRVPRDQVGDAEEQLPRT